MALKSDFEFDDKIDPLKGPNNPTDFLRANFKILGKGGSFRTVKVRFPAKTIEAIAKKSGVIIRVEDETPWLKVVILGRVPPKSAKRQTSRKQDFYKGANKEYPALESKSKSNPAPTPEPNIEPDIFS